MLLALSLYVNDSVKNALHQQNLCIDESDGCGAKLRLTVVSDTFDKVPLIQRHRRVQKALEESGFGMDQIHAITIKAWTVAQYKKKMAN